ncbi:MAG: tail fiber domain-containing protein [Flammeovirgaceae bacterium]
MKKSIFTLLFLAVNLSVYGQSVGINDNNSTPNGKAMLHVQSTTRGFLTPRMTTTQRTDFGGTLGSADQGMMVFDINQGGYYFWTGTAWTRLEADHLGNHTATANLRLNGQWLSNDGDAEGIYVAADGKVGIGTSTVDFPLDVRTGAANARIGEAEIGAWPAASSFAYFGHEDLDHSGFGNYALLQSSSGETFVNSASGQALYFRQGNVTRMLIDAAGDVGIGTGNPNYKLEVNGRGRFADSLTVGNYTFSGIDGSNGQLLMTDGTGKLSWKSMDTTLIKDADGDTKIQVEESADDDKIRFDVAGREWLTIESFNSNRHFRLSFNEPGSNIFLGRNAGYSLEASGSARNIMIGTNAGYSVGGPSRIIFNSVFIGHEAGYHQDRGPDNVMVGYRAGYALNDNGDRNVIIGSEAGGSSTTSGDIDPYTSVFIGYRAGYNGGNGANNVFVGREAGRDITSGQENVTIGDEAGRDITTGLENTLVGAEAGQLITTGRYNTAVGADAGKANAEGDENTYVGEGAGSGIANGTGNVIVGRAAGLSSYDDLKHTVFLGYRTGYNSDSDSSVFIGNRAGYDEVNNHRLYIENTNSTTPLIYGEFDNDLVKINGNLQYTGSFGSASDRRLKSDFRAIEEPLAKLSLLNGLNYTKTYNGKTNREYGLIAQEVQQVFPELVTVFDQKAGYLAVNYLELIPIVIEGMKELRAENEALKAKVSEMEALQKRLAKIEAALQMNMEAQPADEKKEADK